MNKHPKAKCDECPLQAKGSYVPPDFNGNMQAKYLLVGEAPGGTEAKKGKPFTGMSGKLLDATLKEQGIDKSEAVLTNIVLCRPPGNATPGPHEIKCCAPALQDTIELVQPEFVVAMGNSAASSFLGRTTKITQDRVGPPKDTDQGYKLIPTVHPAACLRNPNMFPLFAADIGKLKPHVQIKWEPPQWKAYDDEHKSLRVIKELHNQGNRLVVDLEVGEDKDDTYGHPNTLLAAGIAYDSGKAVVIGERALQAESVRKALTNLLREKDITCHNGKYDLGTLYRMGFGIFKLANDTMFKAYTLDEVPGTKGLKYQSRERLGCPDWDAEIKPYVTGKDGSWHNIPKDILYKYNAYDVGATWDLEDHLDPLMDNDDRRLHDFLCRASDQFMLIESDGIFIDHNALDELDIVLQDDMKITPPMVEPMLDNFDERVKGLIAKNKGFNPNSPDQVKAAFQLMTGARLTTTDIDMLNVLLNSKKPGVKEFAGKMITWRKVAKLYGTYVKGIKERLDDDGRIRTSYLLHGTETGRTSSRNPNVQNTPRLSEYGNIAMRRIYSAEPGNKLIYADYGNIEGRIVGVLADDENMIEILQDLDRDIHSEMAESIFGPKFTKEERVAAKTVVHGKNYARTAHGIAEGLGIKVSTATKISNAYDRRFPRVLKWHEEIKHQVLQTEEPLITPYGRKRRFGLITRDNAEDVYKEALAFKPQSIGSDITLTAAVALRQKGVPVRIFIHDGIVVEVPEADVPETVELMRHEMTEAAKFFTERVPFPVDINVGDNWAEID